MIELSLYNLCLQKVSLLLRDSFWKPRHENPFHCLPSNILHDLVTTSLDLQKQDGFKATSLELVLTSGRLCEFKIHNKNVNQELGGALKYLSSYSQNLEVLTLTNLSCYKPAPSESLQELLKNAPNLKHLHSEVEFDLKALRNCKKLSTVKLHFNPHQPWYDFLEDENGCLQHLESLKLFTICESSYCEFQSVFTDYIVTLLQYCPALTSLGLLETSRALAHLNRSDILTSVKLLRCCWGRSKYPDYEPEYIRDAIEYHPAVKELIISVYNMEGIANLSSLRNLVLLDIHIHIKKDISVLLHNVLKDIALQLKYLSLAVMCPIDISMVLQNCPNLEALEVIAPMYTEFSKTSVKLSNLKHLTINGNRCGDGIHILPLLSDCRNLTELFMFDYQGFDDEILNKFLKKNSLSNLKIALFMRCRLTERGFKKFFLNAPQLEIIEVGNYTKNPELEKIVKNALLETKNKALFNRKLINMDDKFFFKEKSCFKY